MLYFIIIAITYILLYLTVDGHKFDKYVKMNKWMEFGCLDLLEHFHSLATDVGA